jgi:hypothetical protein
VSFALAISRDRWLIVRRKSMAWANAIVPQSCGFLRLPVEIRNKIYEHVINDFSCGPQSDHPIKPRKKGKRFHSPEWRNASRETIALYQLCRQAYIDVVGSGLLYKFRKFYFSSPTSMLNYLCMCYGMMSFLQILDLYRKIANTSLTQGSSIPCTKTLFALLN